LRGNFMTATDMERPTGLHNPLNGQRKN
jgi:hypothetical protein